MSLFEQIDEICRLFESVKAMRLLYVYGIPSKVIETTASFGFGKNKDLCEGCGREQRIGVLAENPPYGFDSMTEQHFERQLARQQLKRTG